MNFQRLIAPTAAIALVCTISAQAEPAEMSAKDLAGKLSGLQQDGASYVRLKMDVRPSGGANFSMQLQIKQRRMGNTTQLVYQVLWPKDRAGQAVFLESSGSKMSGSLFLPPETPKSLGSSQMKDPLFGSALSYADVLENFFSWENQKIAGVETVDHVACQVLESRPGKGEKATATAVRSWIDTRRMVPLKVEKYSSGGTAYRRIETTQVVNDDMGRNIPANLTVTDLEKGTVTHVDGSKLKHGVKYSDSDFSAEGLKNVTPPRS